MTPKTLSAVLLIVIFFFVAQTRSNVAHASQTAIEIAYDDGLAKEPINQSGAAKSPFFPAPKPKAPHGKMYTPHMDELAHIHKFHKERLKKMRKHQEKYWLLSKILLILCHLSVLFIAYMHATH